MLPITEFYKEAKGKDGYKNACKPCARSVRNANYQAHKTAPQNTERVLKCHACGEDKSYAEFYVDADFPHGRNTERCIPCFDAYKKKIQAYESAVINESERRDMRIAELVANGEPEDLIESINLLKAKIKEMDASIYAGIDDLIADVVRGPYAPRTPATITWGGELSHPLHGHLYIIQEREFVKSGEPVYKIGQTQKENPTKRLNQYPNNSNVIDFFKVYDPIGAEAELMRRLIALCADNTLTQRRDIGREYFEGDLSIIQTCMRDVIYG
jgi:hypothetical protein